MRGLELLCVDIRLFPVGRQMRLPGICAGVATMGGRSGAADRADSVARLFVDDVDKRLAGGESSEVIHVDRLAAPAGQGGAA